MILHFPNVDALRLVIAAGLLPADTINGPAQVSFDSAGAIAVETDGKWTKKSAAELTRLGIAGAKRHLGEIEAVSSWLQIVPAVKVNGTPQLSSQAPVLLELESAIDLPTILTEMLRLGNDRQSVRRLKTTAGDDRILLRVVGPPYYTLLRAIDDTASGTTAPLRAYVEAAPRVWVLLGWTHPYAAQTAAPEGQMILIGEGRRRQTFPEAPFQDIYEILKFDLPAVSTEWSGATMPDKLRVPMRLVAGNAADAAELWVIDGAGVDRLDAFIRDSGEGTTQRLKFAVASNAAGRTSIVLRVTASKLAPPVLPFAEVVGYKQYYKLPNLFLPVGMRLHPMLRRDVVRKLLADNPDELVWLAPTAAGGFVPQTLSEDSFRPLEEWVDYILETHHAPLTAWIEASRFEFDSFLCSEALPKPKPPDDKTPKSRKPKGDEASKPLTPNADTKPLAKPTDTFASDGPMLPPEAIVAKPPSEWMIRRTELEAEFLSLDGPLDAPARAALWPHLAEANAGAGDVRESILCRLYGIWNDDAVGRRDLNEAVAVEFPNRRGPVAVDEFESAMVLDNPTLDEVRRFAVMWLLAVREKPTGLLERLPAVQRYLETQEAKLPLRLLWLSMTAVAKLSGADTLGLARTRDRILQRLLEEGIRAERDLPYFLRAVGSKDSERLRQIRSKAMELHALVRSWAEAGLKHDAAKKGQAGQSDQLATLGYTDLMFAYALAKLGEPTEARVLVETARKQLEAHKPDEDRGIAARFLFKAFRTRVEAAIAGKTTGGGLDTILADELEEIHIKGKSVSDVRNNPFSISHYAIMRLREQSNVLEPHEKTNPYHDYMKEKDELRKALAELPKLRDPGQLQRQIRSLYRDGHGGKPTAEERFLVLVTGMPLAGRVGEPFTIELLGLVPEAMKALGVPTSTPNPELPEKQAKLLEHGLMLAANYDRREIVQQLGDQFIDLLGKKTDEQRFRIVNIVAGRCLKSLRKLGAHDEIHKLLARMEATLFDGLPASKVRDRFAATPDLWSKALQSLLYIAGGRLTYGLTEQAEPILDQARLELLGRSTIIHSKDYTPLAQAYIHAVSQGPAEAGLLCLAELFTKMEPARVQNSYTTSKFYSRFHLNVVEELVTALISDDFALGSAGRRWLDEEEYLVRQRIHADMRNQLASASM